MQTLEDLQRLTPSQGALLYRLVELGYLTRTQVDELVNRLVQDRFAKAMEYLIFAQGLDVSEPLHQPQIVSRCYYAMYHAARALVLHVRRANVDDHGRLAVAFGWASGNNYGNVLNRWREIRNQVDYSPYPLPDLPEQAATALTDAEALLDACRDYLQNRGMSL